MMTAATTTMGIAMTSSWMKAGLPTGGTGGGGGGGGGGGWDEAIVVAEAQPLRGDSPLEFQEATRNPYVLDGARPLTARNVTGPEVLTATETPVQVLPAQR